MNRRAFLATIASMVGYLPFFSVAKAGQDFIDYEKTFALIRTKIVHVLNSMMFEINDSVTHDKINSQIGSFVRTMPGVVDYSSECKAVQDSNVLYYNFWVKFDNGEERKLEGQVFSVFDNVAIRVE
jgi:hypothetical protein